MYSIYFMALNSYRDYTSAWRPLVSSLRALQCVTLDRDLADGRDDLAGLRDPTVNGASQIPRQPSFGRPSPAAQVSRIYAALLRMVRGRGCIIPHGVVAIDRLRIRGTKRKTGRISDVDVGLNRL